MLDFLPVAVRRAGRELGAACQDAIFAAECAGCGATTSGRLCPECQALLETRPPSGCRRCGEAVLVNGGLCHDDHRALVGLSWHHAPLRYRGTGARLVHRFKFHADLGAGRFLARTMARHGAAQIRGPWRRAIVVAVPRHASKARVERFDQAAWLAHVLGERLDLPVALGALVRQRATLPQADPRVTNRDANVAGAFGCPAPWMTQDRSVLLVDDVLTSGATARACAAALLAAGTARVGLITAARA